MCTASQIRQHPILRDTVDIVRHRMTVVCIVCKFPSSSFAFPKSKVDVAE